MRLQNLLLISFSVFLFSCASKEVKVKKDIAVNFKKYSKIDYTGKNYYIQETGYNENQLAQSDKDNFLQIIRTQLEKKGFSETKEYSKAHLLVYINFRLANLIPSIPKENIQSMLENEQIPDDAKKAIQDSLKTEHRGNTVVKRTYTKVYYKDGKKVVEETSFSGSGQATISVSVFVQSYGKRPTLSRTFSISSNKESWKELETKLFKTTENQAAKLIDKAPEKNQTMKGDPGCVPRFGYETKLNTCCEVSRVVKGSGAAKAGLKVGDIIIALDSVDYKKMDRINADGDSPFKNIYEKQTSIPIKMKRGDKVIRSNIKAQISCGI